MAILIVLALLVYLIGPLVALIAGLANMRRRGATPVIIVGGVMLAINLLMAPFVLAIAIPSFVKARQKAMEAEVKGSIMEIHAALERYATDTQGLYPSTIEDLVVTGYMDEMPVNPFTSQATREIPFGSSPFEGEFSYVTVLKEQNVAAYWLLGYGSKDTDGLDVNDDGMRDHVILVVSGGYQAISLPPLEELLR